SLVEMRRSGWILPKLGRVFTYYNQLAHPAGTTVWAAGVWAYPLAEMFAEALGVDLGPGGRLPVTRALRVPGHPSVFAVGDVAAAEDPDGTLYPQLAPVAIQQGRHAARQIQRQRRGDDL
ncbi:MAG: hypothetical protein BRD30_01710, partial [Bacteroidetes bacterium QH_2_63_10]